MYLLHSSPLSLTPCLIPTSTKGECRQGQGIMLGGPVWGPATAHECEGACHLGLLLSQD